MIRILPSKGNILRFAFPGKLAKQILIVSELSSLSTYSKACLYETPQ